MLHLEGLQQRRRGNGNTRAFDGRSKTMLWHHVLLMVRHRQMGMHSEQARLLTQC